MLPCVTSLNIVSASEALENICWKMASKELNWAFVVVFCVVALFVAVTKSLWREATVEARVVAPVEYTGPDVLIVLKYLKSSVVVLLFEPLILMRFELMIFCMRVI